MEAAVLIPVKRFTTAKGRLAGLLDGGQRAELARWLATRVVRAAGDRPTFVACDDGDVAAWADDCGAVVLWSPGLGLNGAVDAGRQAIAEKGFDHVVIAHSDLVLAERLDRLAMADTVTLVPDQRRNGTNVLALPIATGVPASVSASVPASVPASYGTGSFDRHLRAALASGHRVHLHADVRLAVDIDDPDDLRHPLVVPELPAWLRTILASHR